MADTAANYIPQDIRAIANLFLDWADADAIEVSPMKLQKLLYFCHADFLVSQNRPLLKQKFEAWDYGPVNPGIYKAFKHFQDLPITARTEAFDPLTAEKYLPICQLQGDDLAFLRSRFDFYKRFSAIALSDLSHSRSGPWRQARSLYANGLNAQRMMTAELIRSHHRLFDS